MKKTPLVIPDAIIKEIAETPDSDSSAQTLSAV